MTSEKEKQETFEWERSINFSEYNCVLGYYQVQSCLEFAHGPAMLDLPCGDGTLTALFEPHFDRVVGVDASSVHLSKARARLPEVEFHEALIEDFTLDEQFDSVFLLNILEHVNDPVMVLRKAASFLKDDGVLIVHVPNARAINRQIAVLMGTLESCEELSPFDINVVGHRRSYTLETLTADIRKAGLNTKTTGGVFYKMLSTPQIDWFLKNGLWETGGFGWGRVGAEQRDWKSEFCRACYEIGKERPEDCNIIFAVITK
ncbi:MAG TPA: class I SAM-dependent methyltransferase [Pyrinomonadaceae bacterium]|jgi:2-polyprenyl-3-methyl-5-hydroxy-6-metoxy-1,4-benzoquinol methylase|nr:class I SAM-dependent methyltransferase [Pyrinomonadaceae bacterium]